MRSSDVDVPLCDVLQRMKKVAIQEGKRKVGTTEVPKPVDEPIVPDVVETPATNTASQAPPCPYPD